MDQGVGVGALQTHANTREYEIVIFSSVLMYAIWYLTRTILIKAVRILEIILFIQ